MTVISKANISLSERELITSIVNSIKIKWFLSLLDFQKLLNFINIFLNILMLYNSIYIYYSITFVSYS